MSVDFQMSVVELSDGTELALEDYELLDSGALHIEPNKGEEKILSPTSWASIFGR